MCAQCAGSYVPDRDGASCVLPCQLAEPLCAACELHEPQACLRCSGNRVLEGGACVDCGELYADKGRNLCVRGCEEFIPGCSLCSREEPERCGACGEGRVLAPGGDACLVVPAAGECPWTAAGGEGTEGAGAGDAAPQDSGAAHVLFALAGILAVVSLVLAALATLAALAGKRPRRAASRRVGGGSSLPL